MASPSRIDSEKGSQPLIRFGPFDLNPETGELWKQGIRIRLQPKPLRILCTLVEKPGVIITREELCRRLWPDGTYVDFESGLNTAVNRLRIALTDSAEQPRYIETLARTGYRFIAPVSTISQPASLEQPIAVVAPPLRRRGILGAAIFAAVALAAIPIVWRPSPARPTRYQQATFRRGQVGAARFIPGKRDIIYAAQWDTQPRQFFLMAAGSTASRPLGFEGQGLAAVSRTGELALLQGSGTMNITGGVLSRAPLNGGPSQTVDHNIFSADWSSDGRLAVARVVAGAQQVEFPIGHILYRTAGWLSNIRVSPADDAIAFIDHPVRHDDAGDLKTVDLAGNGRTLAAGWVSAAGLAWRSRTEIWLTATRDTSPRSLWSVTREGKVRVVGQVPGILTLRDIAPDGTVLFTLESRRLEMTGQSAGENAEHDYSLTDWSRVQQISSDGSLVLFDESGEGSGGRSVAYLRHIRSGEVVRLGDGVAQGLSPDGTSALILAENRTQMKMVPLSGGASRDLPASGLEYQWARFFPAADRLLALAHQPGQPLRLYIQVIATGKTEPLTPPLMIRNAAISPDGKAVAVLTPDGKLASYPMSGGPPHIFPAAEPLAPIRWSRGGEWLYVQHLRSNVQSSSEVSRVNLATGEIRSWKKLAPSDAIGVNSITGVSIADDEKSYVYSYRRVLSTLYVAEGWK